MMKVLLVTLGFLACSALAFPAIQDRQQQGYYPAPVSTYPAAMPSYGPSYHFPQQETGFVKIVGTETMGKPSAPAKFLKGLKLFPTKEEIKAQLAEFKMGLLTIKQGLKSLLKSPPKTPDAYASYNAHSTDYAYGPNDSY